MVKYTKQRKQRRRRRTLRRTRRVILGKKRVRGGGYSPIGENGGNYGYPTGTANESVQFGQQSGALPDPVSSAK